MPSAGDLKLKNGILEFGGANNPGWINNLSINLSGGVLKFFDAQGDALIDANPGFVTVPSTTIGQFRTLKVSYGASFNDDTNASSDLTNLGFGIDEAVVWPNDAPFFLYVANKGNNDITGADGDSVFFLARNPYLVTTPSSADDIGDTGTIPVNDSESVILIMQDVTVANYTSLPCQRIGGLRMQWSASNTDWTVQTLGNSDGIGEGQMDKFFRTVWNMPFQNGSATNTHFKANGGTAPLFLNNSYTYFLNKNGVIFVTVNINGDGGTDGAGAVNAQIVTPYPVLAGFNRSGNIGHLDCTGAANQFIIVNPIAGQKYFELNLQSQANVTNANFGNGARSLVASFNFIPSL